MNTTQQATRTEGAVTLKGSAKMVSEFLLYGINSILYQRGVYPPEDFSRKQEYGLTLLVSTDKEVNKYLDTVLRQTQQWLESRKIKRMVLVLCNVKTKEVMERWEFKVEYETETLEDGSTRLVDTAIKDEKKIKSEMRDVIRQITASVTFLPLLDCPCSFDILIYTHRDADIPDECQESDPCYILNSEDVKLRSFSTAVHQISAAVSYKIDM